MLMFLSIEFPLALTFGYILAYFEDVFNQTLIADLVEFDIPSGLIVC